VANQLYFKNKNCDGKYAEIIDPTGKVVWKGMVQQQRIDVSGLQRGFYMIRLSENNINQKIVKFVKE
jgi:hypothetical protein